MSTKLISFEIENVKRVALVKLTPTENGLTVIGGDNAQGKTSVLDAICFALGGEKYRPSNLQREDGQATARIEITLSNGLKIERTGKNATLKVTDPTGAKAGQKLLDSFVEELALNLPKFLAMKPAEKARTLLQIIGLEAELAELDKQEKAAYDERHAQGRIADQKEKHAAEMPEHHDAPDEIQTAAGVVAEVQAAMTRNTERQERRNNAEKMESEIARLGEEVDRKHARVEELSAMLEAAKAEKSASKDKWQRVISEAATLEAVEPDEDTSTMQAKLDALELVNAKVRANMDKHRAIEDAKHAREEWTILDEKLQEIRDERLALLAGAEMPLPGLSVENGELTYNGKAWDCMSGAEQIRAGAAIIRKLKPECGFILLDKLECLDNAQLKELDAWLKAEDLQGIATRVSKGEECSIIIEDGRVLETTTANIEEW